MGAIAGGIGALLPDIDHPQSLVSAFIPFGFVVSWFTGSHRGITHSLLAVVAVGVGVSVASAYVPMAVALAFIGGYIIHLLADMFTPMGVPLLFPAGLYFRVLPKFILNWTAFIFEAIALVGSLAIIGYVIWRAW